MASHMVLEYDTDPEGEDGRKPPAPEGDTESKGTAPDEGIQPVSVRLPRVKLTANVRLPGMI